MESTWADLLARATDANPAVAAPATRELFRDIVEPMADSFDPAQCEPYADLFSEAIERVWPELRAADLAARYRRIRRPRRFSGGACRVYVLSRVTLGADVAVTSVVLDAMKRRFPDADLIFVGPKKSWELFEADSRLRHIPVSYGRAATLRDRLAVWPHLKAALADGIVVDPDSRLTQLGLLPVCDEERYWFFESRSYGSDAPDPLSALAKRWVEEVFDAAGSPYIAPASSAPEAQITVSLGVGENPAKRIGDPFEEDLLRLLAERGSLLVDKGAGAEEAERVDRAIPRFGACVLTWDGAFAPFAASIARSRLYAGYDSAGGHVATACGVPLISVFAASPSTRFFHRWRPSANAIRLDHPDPAAAIAAVRAALARL